MPDMPDILLSGLKTLLNIQRLHVPSQTIFAFFSRLFLFVPDSRLWRAASGEDIVFFLTSKFRSPKQS